MPEDKRLFNIVRAVGAIICIATLNALVILAFINADAEVPRWSIYMLIMLIGGLLGLDALLEISPVKVSSGNGGNE